jgi:hypothetical protein
VANFRHQAWGPEPHANHSQTALSGVGERHAVDTPACWGEENSTGIVTGLRARNVVRVPAGQETFLQNFYTGCRTHLIS